MTDREMLALLREMRLFCDIRQLQALDRAIALLSRHISSPE